MKIALMTGGEGSEREVALQSSKNVQSYLQEAHEITTYDYPSEWPKFVEDHQITPFDAAIPVLHGKGGEDGEVQERLDALSVRYLFSNPATHKLALQKDSAKDIAVANGVTIARSRVVKPGESASLKESEIVIIKPLSGGSSFATTKVSTPDNLQQALDAVWSEGDDALIEDFITGREFTVSVVEHTSEALALEPVEILKNPEKVFDYHEKYSSTSQTQEACPAEVTPEQKQALQHLARTMHKALGCRHASRTDIIMSGDQFIFLETNTIPGMTDRSLLPLAAKQSGLPLSQLLQEWLEEL